MSTLSTLRERVFFPWWKMQTGCLSLSGVRGRMPHLVSGEMVNRCDSSLDASISIFSCILSIDDFANSPTKTAITTLTNTRATTNK